jgi:hypothetical protein
MGESKALGYAQNLATPHSEYNGLGSKALGFTRKSGNIVRKQAALLLTAIHAYRKTSPILYQHRKT